MMMIVFKHKDNLLQKSERHHDYFLAMREELEHNVTTGKICGKRDGGRKQEKVLGSLSS